MGIVGCEKPACLLKRLTWEEVREGYVLVLKNRLF